MLSMVQIHHHHLKSTDPISFSMARNISGTASYLSRSLITTRWCKWTHGLVTSPYPAGDGKQRQQVRTTDKQTDKISLRYGLNVLRANWVKLTETRTRVPPVRPPRDASVAFSLRFFSMSYSTDTNNHIYIYMSNHYYKYTYTYVLPL
jgi:hypothetical protein